MAQSENELKYELSQPVYHGLLALLPSAGETLSFSNAYFVVAEDTGRRDWVLRLRRPVEGGAELTLKVGRETSPGTFRSTEYTARVDSFEPGDWEETEPLLVFRKEISKAAVLLQGEVRNDRHRVRAPLGPVPVWEVDSTTLPDGTQCYELEIEYPVDVEPSEEEVKAFRAEVEAWMVQRDWPTTVSRKTKYRRFLDAVSAP